MGRLEPAFLPSRQRRTVGTSGGRLVPSTSVTAQRGSRRPPRPPVAVTGDISATGLSPPSISSRGVGYPKARPVAVGRAWSSPPMPDDPGLSLSVLPLAGVQVRVPGWYRAERIPPLIQSGWPIHLVVFKREILGIIVARKKGFRCKHCCLIPPSPMPLADSCRASGPTARARSAWSGSHKPWCHDAP
jgi:hypothetical protein